MQKIHRSLTKEQRRRGIVFSSTLSNSTIEQDGDVIHEVEGVDKTVDLASEQFRINYKIKLLKDDTFFKDSPWRYNIIRK